MDSSGRDLRGVILRKLFLDVGEFCDDGNLDGASLCNSDCSGPAPSFFCYGGDLSSPSICRLITCYDGFVDSPETCDDSDID